MASEKPYKGEIYNWEVTKYPPDQFWPNAPLHDGFGLLIRGRPSGHPKFEDFIRTSPVVSWHELPCDPYDVRVIEVETENSRYRLIGEGKGL